MSQERYRFWRFFFRISEHRKIWLIDLELTGPNYRGFDLMKLFRTNDLIFSVSLKLCSYAEECDRLTARRKLLCISYNIMLI